MPLKGQGFPEAIIIYEDLKYPDMVWVELSWNRALEGHELAHVHRALQKKYRANFPYRLRVKGARFANTYTFMGIRAISEREAQKHTIYQG